MPSMIKEICADGIIPKGIQAFMQQALQNLADAHDMIIESWVFQTHKVNHCQWAEPTISIGDLVYLSTHNLKLPQGQAEKLCPKFVGPYKVLHAKSKSSNYTLELPTALQKQRIFLMFHISLLCLYNMNNDTMQTGHNQNPTTLEHQITRNGSLTKFSVIDGLGMESLNLRYSGV